MRQFAAALAALFLLAACNGGDPAPTPTATPTPTPAPTPTASPTPTPAGPDIGPAEFDPVRAFAHVEALADGIGSRPAGSGAEREAAAYLRDELASYGYETELQPFSFERLTDEGSRLDVLSPGARSFAVAPFDPSLDGAAESELVDAGIGRPEDFPAKTASRIALVQRGTLTFGEKIANAAAAGARGALVYNDQPGLFSGDLKSVPEIPALAISLEDGQELASLVAAGTVRVRMEVRTSGGPSDSQNVVARPPAGQCRLLAGGHYDSVAAGPGANDNGSGTATVLEIARVLAADGVFDDVCFALFGSEEIGLIGSSAYVQALSEAEAGALIGMFNLDMVGTGERWLFGGSQSLAEPLAAEAGARQLEFQVLGFSADIGGSDHAPFINAGIPAVFLHGFTSFIADDPDYHTARDRPGNVQVERLEQVGALMLAAIDELLAEG